MTGRGLPDPWALLREAEAEAVASPVATVSQRPATDNLQLDQEVNPTVAAVAAVADPPTDPQTVSRPFYKERKKDFSLSFQYVTRDGERQNEAGSSPLAADPEGSATVATIATKSLSLCSRDEIGFRDAATVIDPLLAWRQGLGSLSVDRPPCPGFRSTAEWAAVLAQARRFLDEFGEEAASLGWTTPLLFGVHPRLGIIRADHCGALMLSVLRGARAITASTISGANVTFYRDRPGRPEGVPVWEFDPSKLPRLAEAP